MASPFQRLPAVTLDNNGAVSIPISMTGAMIGQKHDFQFWYRDPNDPAGFGVGLSNAVEVQFCY